MVFLLLPNLGCKFDHFKLTGTLRSVPSKILSEVAAIQRNELASLSSYLKFENISGHNSPCNAKPNWIPENPKKLISRFARKLSWVSFKGHFGWFVVEIL